MAFILVIQGGKFLKKLWCCIIERIYQGNTSKSIKVKFVLKPIGPPSQSLFRFPHSMKPEYYYFPLDGMLVHPKVTFPAFHQASLTIFWYLFILLDGEGYCERTQHIKPPRFWPRPLDPDLLTQTSWPRVQCTDYKATLSPGNSPL